MLHFDGSTEYVNLGQDLFSSNEGTILVVNNADSYPGDDNTIFSASNLTEAANHSMWVARGPAGKFHFGHWVDGSNNQINVNEGLNTGQDYHFVVSTNGSTWKMYIDSVEKSVTVVVGSNSGKWFNDLGAGTFDYVIGAWIYADGDKWFDGKISDLQIFNRQLSNTEIGIKYESKGSDNIVNGLVGRWLMNEKQDGATASGANSVIDISGQGNSGTAQNSPIYRPSEIKLIKSHTM